MAGTAAVAGALLVLLRHRLAGLVQPDLLVLVVGVSAVLTGLLRIVGGFAAERRFGRRWTLGGIVLGSVETALGVVLVVSARVDPRGALAGRRRVGRSQWCRAPGRRTSTAPVHPQISSR